MRAKLVPALLACLIVAGCMTAAADGHLRHTAPLADPSDYRIDSLEIICFEPDVYNISDEVKTFAFQLQVGDEFSEVQVNEVQPGGLAHLHIFEGYWSPGPEHDRLVKLAEREPCNLWVFDAAAPDGVAFASGGAENRVSSSD